jgi:NarL family two-component system response regulator YdfI
VISVLVAAASLVVRAGLKSLVEQTPECTVVGSTSSTDLVERALELHPDVILWQNSRDEDAAPVLHALPHQPVVLLTSNGAADLIRAGARGVLAPGASEAQIAIALQAAAADLVVLSPESTAAPAAAQTASVLTPREIEVLGMIAAGLANKEIAYRLGISEHTVKFHVSSLLGKLGAGSRAEAVGAGIRQGIIML